MKYIIHLFIISFPFFIAPLFGQDSFSFPVKLELAGFQEVFAKVGDLYISGQPSAEAFAKLKSEGVTTVINLRT